MLSEESIKSTIVDTIGATKKLDADIKQMNDEKERETDQSSVSSCDTLLTEYTPIELDSDDLYHASLCSKVVCESNDTKQCSQLLQSSSHRSLQAISMTQLENQVTFPKCMIALFSDDSGSKTCFVAFDDFTFQKILNLSEEHSGSTFGTG